MRLTKFVHACVLAEEGDKVALFDPGSFSWDSGLINIDNLNKLDAIVITHEHFDHFHLPAIQALVKKFPNVQIITTPSVVKQLSENGIQNASSEGNEFIKIFSTKRHAPLAPFGEAPENIAVHFADKLTVGGDRHDLEESKEILALTATAPWGSMLEAANMALKLKPKSIFPVHDWHWNDQARSGSYDMFESVFDRNQIKFIKTVDGQSFEL
ncbi:MAG TPA: MBL fold metallo-hydrolase [Candidatus Saccharimonadales bacterium]|nr:MBL fold metallo-hydrolase [Candidatus Saccharimonadales bacterium]